MRKAIAVAVVVMLAGALVVGCKKKESDTGGGTPSAPAGKVTPEMMGKGGKMTPPAEKKG